MDNISYIYTNTLCGPWKMYKTNIFLLSFEVKKELYFMTEWCFINFWAQEAFANLVTSPNLKDNRLSNDVLHYIFSKRLPQELQVYLTATGQQSVNKLYEITNRLNRCVTA